MKAALIAFVFVGLVAVGLPTVHALRYEAFQITGNFYESLHTCILHGGYLVAIETPTQNVKVMEAIKKLGGNGPWWTSGTDFGMEGAWMWLSRHKAMGAINGYTNFETGRPVFSTSGGDNCIAIYKTGLWRDVPCNSRLSFVCEFTF
uniref:C-type lectin domain-containing protein n=1 Tax=Anopheles culicifacies TaxID=139723 RepID=A0A182MFJ5_9DIPT